MKIAAIFLTLFLLYVTTFAQRPDVKLIADFVAAKQKYHNFNGNVLVAEKGKIIFKKSAGYSDIEAKIPLTDKSAFEIASISKQFTAAAVLLCVERDLLKLDDPLLKYFPELPYEGVTVRQMLTHTSGLPEQNELMYKVWNSDKPATNRDMLDQLIKNRPPAVFKAGGDFTYCNTNYSLLAMIVEKVSGLKFPDFMSRNFFTPLSMKNTRIMDWEKDSYNTVPNHTRSYIFDDESKAYRPAEDIPQWKKAIPLSGMIGSRGVDTTAIDLLKWQESLNSAKILKPESIAEMEKPQVEGRVDGSDAYGYGLAIKSIYGDTKIFHNGGWNGYWTSHQHFEKADRTVIVLSNNDNERGLANAIAAILFGQKIALPSKHVEVRLTPAQLDKFVGTYEAKGRSFSIESKDGKLFRVQGAGSPVEIKAESASKLFYTDGSDRQIEFIYGKKGLSQVFFIADGIKLELKKLK